MASCDPFTVDFQGSAEDLFTKVSALVHDHNGRITGGPAGGAISVSTPVGSIDAKYTIDGQVLTATVTKRPFFLPCSAIQSFVRSNVSTVEATALAEL